MIDLAAPDLAARFTAGNPNAGACNADDHALAAGTVEIVSYDAAGITFAVRGSRTYQFDAELGADGLYSASFCP